MRTGLDEILNNELSDMQWLQVIPDQRWRTLDQAGIDAGIISLPGTDRCRVCGCHTGCRGVQRCDEMKEARKDGSDGTNPA